MPCDHIGPADVVEYAETHLRERGLPPEEWEGTRAEWGGVAESGLTIHIEVTRDHDDWRVTRLDRNREPLAADEVGFRVFVVTKQP